MAELTSCGARTLVEEPRARLALLAPRGVANGWTQRTIDKPANIARSAGHLVLGLMHDQVSHDLWRRAALQ
ncbi:MAG: hypothetical protein ACTH01_15535, partial [Micrococcaceae bacterium]